MVGRSARFKSGLLLRYCGIGRGDDAWHAPGKAGLGKGKCALIAWAAKSRSLHDCAMWMDKGEAEPLGGKGRCCSADYV